MPKKCDGTERHEHYVIATDTLMTHSHEHTERVDSNGISHGDFNRLHHHAPVEHSNFTVEELETDAMYADIPF
jgi:predicted Ser/Thr protein kinase